MNYLQNSPTFRPHPHLKTQDGATGAELCSVLFETPEADVSNAQVWAMSELWLQVLRPLVWSGLLQQIDGQKWYQTAEETFVKTPLWEAGLVLKSDSLIVRHTRH